ncbi:MAG: hypothetical protein KF819_29670 [Labilithrix sp.]|nr:hypothetical protein [Labilithrix sp.]
MKTPTTPATLPSTKLVARSLMFLLEVPHLLVAVAMILFALDALLCIGNQLRPSSVRHTLPIVMTVALLRAVLRAWLRPGYLRALDELRRGAEPTVKAFEGLDRLGAAFACHLLGDVIVATSLVVGALPGLAAMLFAANRGYDALVGPALALAALMSFSLYLYAWLGVRYAEHAVAIEGLGPFAALGRAWNLAEGRRARVAWVTLVTSTLELAAVAWGVACFGVGLLLTVPLARLVGDHTHVALFAELRATSLRPRAHAGEARAAMRRAPA